MKTITGIAAVCLLGLFGSAYAQKTGPQIRFGNFEQYGLHEASVKDILSQPKFTSLTPGCKVVSFDINGTEPNKEFIGPYHSKSNMLTSDQIRYIRSLYKNCKMWMCNIHVKCSDGTEYVLGKGDTEFSIYNFTITE